METPLIVIAAITVLGLLYVTLPIFMDYFRRYNRKRVVHCPEAGILTEIDIDARRAAFFSLFGKARLKVADCLLWPWKKNCNQRCLK